ncbi:MAG: hypothetical protein Q4P06_03450 [Actinomycetaceae bacterium]|nr:hypothetical protein [Actinomycetaceae bacterium]
MARLVKTIAVPLLFTVVGVVLTVVSILATTVMRPGNHITAIDEGGSEPYVSTHVGVLTLLDPPVKVTARSDAGEEVSLVVGKANDVSAWLEGSAYREINGLKTWSELKTSNHPAPEEAQQREPLQDSDMWLEKKVGTGSVTLELGKDKDLAPLSVIAATDGTAAAPKLELTWQREVSLAWALVLGAVGLLLIIIGLTLWYQLQSRSRKANNRKQALARQRERRRQAEPEVISTQVGQTTIQLPSRRAMREARERGEASVTVGGRKFDTGLIPVVEKVRDVEEPELRNEEQTAAEDENTNESKIEQMGGE